MLDDDKKREYWESKSIRRYINENLLQYLRHKFILDEHKSRIGGNEWWSELMSAHHHGLKSLLLDWTSNPLVALYFAVENILTKDKQHDRGAVYALKVKEPLSTDEDRRWFDFSEVVAKFPYGEFCPHWIMINPPLNTDRLIRQSGKFSYHPSIVDGNLVHIEGDRAICSLGEQEALVKVVIGGGNSNPTDGIRRELGIMNIHHGSLFPDHDGFASYINEEWRKIAGPMSLESSCSKQNIQSPALDEVRDFIKSIR